MPEADETIITRIVLESADAVKNAQTLRADIEKVKEELKKLSAEGKGSIKDLANGMKEHSKQIRDNLVANLREAFKTNDIQKFNDVAKTSFDNLYKLTRQDLSAGIKKFNQDFAYSSQVIKSASSELQKGTQGFRLFGQEISNLGDLAKVVFIGIFGVSVVSALRKVTQSLVEAAQAGYEFGKAMFQLEVGARALQRAGVDITIEQIYGQIGKLQDRFKIFTTKDLVVGTAAFLNLNRDMGFTREQLFKLQDAIATLAVVNGRAMDEVQRTVALALSSGYTEGLQRLGVSINRVTIANEAQRLGFAKSYMSLTEQQRALATYNLVIQKTAVYENDLPKAIYSTSGAIDRAKTIFQELTNTIGKLISTNFGIFLRDVFEILDSLAGAADKFRHSDIGRMFESAARSVLTFAKNSEYAQAVIDNLADRITKLGFAIVAILPPIGGFLIALGRLLRVGNELNQGILGDETVNKTEQQAERIQQVVEDSLQELEDFEKQSQEKRKDYETDYQRDIEKLERDAARNREEIARDLARDLEKIDADGRQKQLDLQKDYFNRLREITERLSQDIAQENAKYALDVAQTLRQFALRRQELEANYRENEIKAEIRFQEEMRRLREGFLFDLEDALHERDARQVLRLIRQYNLQKSQAERQYDIERDERRRAFELELRELEVQRQERLRILAEEHAARIAALQAQAAYEQELARRRYEEEKAEAARRLEEEKAERIAKALEAEEELKRKLEEAKAERKILLDQQIADLQAERDRLLQEIGEKLWSTLQITTTDGLKLLYDALNATLGPDGGADQVFQYYAGAAEVAAKEVEGSLTRVAAMMAQLYAFVAQLNSLSVPSPGGGGGGGGGGTTTPKPRGNPRQSGGPVYAGEVYAIHKDETFIPAVNGNILNAQQSKDAVADAYRGRGFSSEGKLKIGIDLSDGLVGSIIENTLDEVADVVMETPRKRR